MPEVDDDGMMRVAVSPGGSIHQVVQKPAPKSKVRSLLSQRREEEPQEVPQGMLTLLV